MQEPVGLLCPHLEQPDDSVLPHLTQKFESDEFCPIQQPPKGCATIC
jgi:hypothetical protein